MKRDVPTVAIVFGLFESITDVQPDRSSGPVIS
jgi:hypothetical protein